jgi:predicted ArsR family transcriptional regulator
MDAAAAISALADPVRAAVYDAVVRHEEPVGRDLVAEHTGLARSTAAFHLDRLAASGLLVISYARPAGRTGPGAGRPAKLYRRADSEVAVSVPARSYDLMAGLLATAIEQSAADGRPVLEALRAAATDAGRTSGAHAGSFDALLTSTGYEPAYAEDGVVMMNCPFHRLAEAHTEVVCAANHAFLCGAAAATGRDPADVVLEPGAGRCCVRVATG